jgi:plasmid stabilization system protein ParE
MTEGRRGIIGVMTDVTQIFSQIESGDPSAAEQLLPLVYDELRKLAAPKLATRDRGRHCKEQRLCMKPTYD